MVPYIINQLGAVDLTIAFNLLERKQHICGQDDYENVLKYVLQQETNIQFY